MPHADNRAIRICQIRPDIKKFDTEPFKIRPFKPMLNRFSAWLGIRKVNARQMHLAGELRTYAIAALSPRYWKIFAANERFANADLLRENLVRSFDFNTFDRAIERTNIVVRQVGDEAVKSIRKSGPDRY